MTKATSPQRPAATAAFNDHAVAIAKRQYFQPGDENVEGMFRRVANWVAQPERAAEREAAAERFYELMIEQRFCPGGRVLAGAATQHGNVLNCFVQDGRPQQAGTDAWVLNLATKLALVTKVGGGNGVNLDPIAPKRHFAGKTGRLYLTVTKSHPDYDKIRTGTFLDLVRGEMVTRGYRAGTFVERDAVPASATVRRVADSVDDIWQAAADMAMGLLRGQDVLVDLSDLRAEGTPVKGSGGTSSGPSSFAVEVYDNFAIWAGLGGAEHAGPVATLRYVFAPTLRAIRQGGCLVPETLVNTSRGTLRLSELVEPHQYGWQDHNLKVATDEGWRDSPRGFNNGNSDTVIVELANGQVIQGTPRHRLKVMRPNGERDWVRLEDLRPEDHVIQVLDQHTGAPVSLRPVEPPHHNAHRIRQPEQLSERLAFFLGYLWGDGFVSSGRVGLAVAHGSPMMQEAPVLFHELFDLDVSLEQKPNDASAVWVTKSAHLIEWLEANGLSKGRARTLELPKAIRMAPRPVVGAFLRGLFEADGSVTHGYPTLGSASKRLIQDVAVMLAGLGIPSTQRGLVTRAERYSRNAAYHLKVASSIGLARFIERVGAMPGSRLEACNEHVADTTRETSWHLPHAEALLEGALQALPSGAKGRPAAHTGLRKTLLRYSRGERGLTAVAYRRLRREERLAGLLPEFAEDEYYVPIRSVSDGPRSLTLDLSVDENKTYLANGVVSHNTRRGAGMATLSITHPDVQDFITAKDLEREQAEGDISTFNISVLVTDEFMTASLDARQGVLMDIAQHAWATGEPGLIYIDRINQYNPMRAALGDIKSTNPCVTADTWVQTQTGARQVHELVGRRFCAVVDGKAYGLESDGFWSTGVKPVFKVRTRRGFELRLTGNHKLSKVTRLERHALETRWHELSELSVGDRVVLQNQRQSAPWVGEGTLVEGWLLGTLVGDGTFITDKARPMAALDFWGERLEEFVELAVDALERIGEERPWVTMGEGRARVASAALASLAARFDIVHGGKSVTDVVERAGYDFYRGFLRGLFDADGSVQGSQAKGVSVRLAQSDSALLHRVQRMLARFGIIATLYADRRPAGQRSLPDGRGGNALYECRADHELVVSGENLAVFAAKIGFEHPAKQAKLEAALAGYKRRLNRERFYDKIVSIEPDGEAEVFDVTVERVHAFDANGIAAHNCGEIPLYPGEPCDLGAINLAAYVARPGEGTAGFDFDAFTEDTRTCVRFLDNVLDVNVFALEDNREMSMKLRRLGLGVMGLADALIRMGYAYDSDAGRQAVDEVISAMRDAATAASEDLAKERGAFPLYDDSGLRTPRRNVAVLTVAPTGTTSMLMGVSSGVEPVFAPFIYRKIGTDYHALIHPLFQELLERHAPASGFEKDGAWDWDKVVEKVQANHGSVQGLDFVPDDVRAVLICAHDIAAGDHVKMQGVVQRAFDGGKDVANSISKTINLVNDATAADVFDAYAEAFVSGCKGITVYRDGSRDFQVLSTSTTPKKSEADSSTAAQTAASGQAGAATTPTPAPAQAPAPASRAAGQRAAQPQGHYDRLPGEPLFDRPLRLSGFTDQVKLMLPSGEKRGFFVTVNKQDGLPTEVFIVSGKAGDEANADSEALGRVVSIALQYGVPAEALVKTLRGINGGMYGSYHGRMVASKADLLAVALETAGVENVLNHQKGCPDCGAPLRFEEGCQKCESCGYSKCG